MALTQIVQACSQDLANRLQAIPEIADKTLEMYDNDQLLSTVEELNVPCVGIVYGGLRPKEDKRGLVAEAIFDLYLVGGERCRSATSTLDGREGNLTLLDAMRDVVLLERGPGSRFWRFLQETPVSDLHPSAMGYLQRWGTGVALNN